MAQKGYIKNSLTKDLGAPEMANMFQGIFGSSGIMSLYENLVCVKVDNNTVRMSSGAYNLSGHLLGIAKGTTEDLTIDSGTSGQNRNDLIVAEFVRNGGGLGVDTLHFTIVKGTSTSGAAADPALTQQDINAAGVTRQEALYRVKVTGTEITAVEKVAGSVSNLNLVQSGGLAGAFSAMPFVGNAPIVESGSNAKGNWSKFADGTMICWTTLTSINVNQQENNVFGSTSGISYYGFKSWEFPLAFISTPVVLTDVSFSVYVGLVSKTRDKTASGVTIAVSGAQYPSVSVDCFSIGRWK